MLRNVHLVVLTGAILCVHFVYICVRTLRWQLVILDKNPGATFGTLYWITAIVVSLAILTPSQIGETVKVEMLKRRGFGSRLPGLGSFALERVLDILTLAGFGLVGLAFGSGLSGRFPELPAIAATLLGARSRGARLARRFPSVFVAARLDHPPSFGHGDGGHQGQDARPHRSVVVPRRPRLADLAPDGRYRRLVAAVCWLVSLVTFGTLISLCPGA